MRRFLYAATVGLLLAGHAAPGAAQATLNEVQRLVGNSAAQGGQVAISGNTAVGRAFSEATAQWNLLVYERDPATNTWSEVKTLVAAPGDIGVDFAISGDTIVGTSQVRTFGPEDTRGAAYVFERDEGGAGNWGQVAELSVSFGPDAVFGSGAAIDGSTLAVNARSAAGVGAVFIFERIGGAWSLTDSALVFGDLRDVALHSDTLVAGAIGQVLVYERDEGGVDQWGLVTELVRSPPPFSDQYGNTVAVHGDTVAVGARDHTEGDPSVRLGAVYLFERNQGGANAWGQLARVTASDGQDDDRFGGGVALRGDLLLVGAPEVDGAGEDSGAVYTFGRNQGGANVWGQLQKLTPSGSTEDDHFGTQIGITGSQLIGFTAIIGIHNEHFHDARSAAYIFGNTRARPITDTVSGQVGAGSGTFQIASVSDDEQSPETLIARINGGENATTNGVTVSNLVVGADGAVTADVDVACGASDASFELSFEDDLGLVSTASLDIEVAPSDPPVLQLASPGHLWPPSPLHWPVPAFLLVKSATDDCDGNLRHEVVIEQVTSDEPDDAPGLLDGRTRHDIIAPFCEIAFLRAERNLAGNGRVYGVTLRVRDSEGNETRAVFPVGVPITRRGTAVEDAPAQTVATGCP